MKHVLGYLRRAEEDHSMIKDGETIAVGVSGGKDSMLLLYALHLYKNFARVRYNIHAFTVDLGFGGEENDVIADYCKSIDIPHNIIKTHISAIVNRRKENNPCALCSKMRKGALFTQIKQHGFSVCAFAHHREDCIESLLLSMLYEGRMRTFRPVTLLDRMDIRLIRPFIYLPEKEIRAAVKRHGIPVSNNPCPAAGSTKREEIKRLLMQICASRPDANDMIINSIKNVSHYSLWN